MMEARGDDHYPESSSWSSTPSRPHSWSDDYNGHSRYVDPFSSYPPSSYSDMPWQRSRTSSSSSSGEATSTPYAAPSIPWQTSAKATYPPAIPPASASQNYTDPYKNQYSSSSSSTSEETPSMTPTPIPETDREHDPFAPGLISAAVIVPLLALAIIGAVLFLLLRRRRRRRQRETLPPELNYTTDDRTTSSHPPQPQMTSTSTNHLIVPLGPIITSEQNNAYFTGLDTNSSHNSRYGNEGDEYYAPARLSVGGTTFVDAPPPYKSSKSEDGDADPPPGIGEVYDVSPMEQNAYRSPFDDPDPEGEYDGIDGETDVSDGLLFAPGNISSDRLGDILYPSQRRRDEGNPFEDPPSPVHDAGSQHLADEDMMRRDWRGQ